MAVAGITVERTLNGRPEFVRIDLLKHADFIPLLEEEDIENEYLIDIAESRLDEETVSLDDIFKKYDFK